MTRRGWTRDRFRAAPQAAAIAVAAAVVVAATVVSAIAAPGHHTSWAGVAHPTGAARASSAAPGGHHGANSASGGVTQPSGDGVGDDRSGGDSGDGSTTAAGSTTEPATPGVPVVPDSIQHRTELGGRTVAVTIDDGPDPMWTPKVLQVLREHHVHATFCMIGPQAAAHPDLVRRVVAEGHRLCDHTVHHDTTMDHKPYAYQRSEILDALHMIETASGGARVYYYRAPGGAFTPPSRALAARHGMRPLGWNVDTKDFDRPGVTTIVQTVESEVHNGPTILFHDGGGNRAQTVAALDRVLTWLSSQGYAFSFPAVD